MDVSEALQITSEALLSMCSSVIDNKLFTALGMQVASGILNDLPNSMQGPLHAESLCMDLAAAHMTLLQIAEKAAEQQQRQKGDTPGLSHTLRWGLL